jgi:hypothetical protein
MAILNAAQIIQTAPIQSCAHPPAVTIPRFLAPVLAVFLLLGSGSLSPSVAHAQPTLTPQEIVHRIDDAVALRTRGVAGYSVQELYSIYRNGESTPSVQVTVKTVYNRASGKEYTPISETGSGLLRSVIVNHILTNEKEMAKAANRDSVALTSANYEMTPEPGIVNYDGHPCVLVHLKARRKTTYLLNGKGWFDASDFTLVRLEGAPVQSPSFFAGQTGGRRDYIKINGFSMAQHAEMRSHSFLFGDTLLKIDYTDYQVQLDPSAVPASTTTTATPSPSAPATK